MEYWAWEEAAVGGLSDVERFNNCSVCITPEPPTLLLLPFVTLSCWDFWGMWEIGHPVPALLKLLCWGDVAMMRFLSHVILSSGKMVIIKKGKRDVWMTQIFLTRSHRPMVLYLKSVFYIGSRETGMWAGQRCGKELPAEHSVSSSSVFPLQMSGIEFKRKRSPSGSTSTWWR